MKKFIVGIMVFAMILPVVGCDDYLNSGRQTMEVTTMTEEAIVDKTMKEILKTLDSEVKSITHVQVYSKEPHEVSGGVMLEEGIFFDDRISFKDTYDAEVLALWHGGTIEKYATVEEAEKRAEKAFAPFENQFYEVYGVYVIYFSVSLTSDLTETERQDLAEAIKSAIG